MLIKRLINKQAKSNGGIAHKLWKVDFTDKDLVKVSMMKGNEDRLIYNRSAEFFIDVDQDYTRGSIVNKDSGKKIEFEINIESISDLFNDVSYIIHGDNGDVVLRYDVRYPKSSRGYKTASLYSFFVYLVKNTWFLADTRSEDFISKYEKELRKKISQAAENQKKRVVRRKKKTDGSVSVSVKAKRSKGKIKKLTEAVVA